MIQWLKAHPRVYPWHKNFIGYLSIVVALELIVFGIRHGLPIECILFLMFQVLLQAVILEFELRIK